MEQIDPRSILIKVVKILNKLKVPYLITGGIAVLVWGRPRFTADIDIVIEFEGSKVNAMEKELLSLSEFSYVDKEAIADALKNKGEFNYIDGYSGVKVDFWVADNTDFTKNEFKRSKPKVVLGQRVNFISPEDLIIRKLKWYKESQSSKQLEDIESVIKISGKKLDENYLKSWAAKLGLEDLLNEVGLT